VSRVAAAFALLALAAPLIASAHEPGAPTVTGFVATVSAVEPLVVGVDARVVFGDQLLVTNRTSTLVEILDRSGTPFIRIASGKSRTWHDDRIVGQRAPPLPASDASESAPRFVKNWSVPGRTKDRAFRIKGFLGYVPPERAGDEGTPTIVLAGGALVLVALSALAAYLLGRGRS
jgi:hypothetical protein